MAKQPCHLSDEEMLLVLDGEASPRRAKHAESHLAACWSCRSRSAELQRTIAEFVSLRGSDGDAQLTDGTGSRALLKARLAEAANNPPSARSWTHLLQMVPAHRLASIAGIIVLTVLGGMLLLQHSRLRGTAVDPYFASAAIPDHNLTPGATRPVSIGDVCSMPHEEVVRDVPSSLREEVFREYGIVNPRPEDYEIDYLIAPGLGGAEDIHNLWPEPAVSSRWNAHVKDALEERLHQLVCNGELDLNTAQKEIATDWIKAYKKYSAPPNMSSLRTIMFPGLPLAL